MKKILKYIEYAKHLTQETQELYLASCYGRSMVNTEKGIKLLNTLAWDAISECEFENAYGINCLIVESMNKVILSFKERVLSLKTLKSIDYKGPQRKTDSELQFFISSRDHKVQALDLIDEIQRRLSLLTIKADAL